MKLHSRKSFHKSVLSWDSLSEQQPSSIVGRHRTLNVTETKLLVQDSRDKKGKAGIVRRGKVQQRQKDAGSDIAADEMSQAFLDQAKLMNTMHLDSIIVFS